MKIGILGTRGIPNNYGGFEQWAEQLSQGLIKKGCQVIVYSSHFHPYKKDEFKGVDIVHIWDPKKIGLASQFIYDFLCIINARKQKFDAVIQLGYTTSSVWAFLLPKKVNIIYNMDGMEWKREKYKGLLKSFLKYAESLAVKFSNKVIADSKPIKTYLDKKYNINSNFIAYPAEIPTTYNLNHLNKFGLKEKNYLLIIARFQPDNNFEPIIDGVLESNSNMPLIIIGDNSDKYGKYLKEKYKNAKIKFLGKIYDKNVLDSLRHYSYLYFHGHSAGGTNPSLLEAMATSSIICAHNNEFNKSVLNEDAFYFQNYIEVTNILNENKNISNSNWIENNLSKLRNEYKLDLLVNKYYKLL